MVDDAQPVQFDPRAGVGAGGGWRSGGRRDRLPGRCGRRGAGSDQKERGSEKGSGGHGFIVQHATREVKTPPRPLRAEGPGRGEGSNRQLARHRELLQALRAALEVLAGVGLFDTQGLRHITVRRAFGTEPQNVGLHG